MAKKMAPPAEAKKEYAPLLAEADECCDMELGGAVFDAPAAPPPPAAHPPPAPSAAPMREAMASRDAGPAEPAWRRLLEAQRADGRWGEGDDAAVMLATADALAALAREGITAVHPLYGPQVKKAVGALLELIARGAARWRWRRTRWRCARCCRQARAAAGPWPTR
ncbi:MAG: hypothetical protein R3A52_28145 [Polyangiales bacterium]